VSICENCAGTGRIKHQWIPDTQCFTCLGSGQGLAQRDVTRTGEPVIRLSTRRKPTYAGPCPSRFLAHLGFPEPTSIPCGLSAGHDGMHHYEARWNDATEADR
jgi:hypothetical protein